jgi:long-chain acyl-CoA synthetase
MRVRSLALSCQTLKAIIYTNGSSNTEACNCTFHVAGRSIVVVSFKDVIASGMKGRDDCKQVLVESPFYQPTAESLCLVTFTTGATGKPKGVMIRHASIVAAVKSFTEALGLCPQNDESNQEVYLAHQPPARVVEFTLEMTMLSSGAAIGYAGTSSLHLASFKAFEPTHVCLVPSTYETLGAEAEEEMRQTASSLVRSVQTVSFVSASFSRGRFAPISSLVLRRCRKVLGGRVKICLSSGSALNKDIQNFFRVALGAPTAQLYGLTEACGVGALQLRDNNAVSIVGAPMPGVEIRLASCLDEFGGALALDGSGRPYLPSDRFHLGIPCLGRGEITIRGAMVASAYYAVRPSYSTLTEGKIAGLDGWCATGDIGVWTMRGELMLVDRIKNFVKLKSGEYVALESMERAFNRSAFVDRGNGGVLCFADDKMAQPVALVQVPHQG